MMLYNNKIDQNFELVFFTSILIIIILIIIDFIKDNL